MFKNKVVLVTGSGSGMGEATAVLFAKEGADIVIVDWNEDNANKTSERCKVYGNRVLVIKADISKDAEAKEIITKTINDFGKLDVLVNNAGILREGKLLSGNIMDTYDEVLAINLRAVVLLTSLATPYLIDTKGCIVNVSSTGVNARKSWVFPAYVVSKSGVDSFTHLSALELASSGVRVNAVNPGPVDTNIRKHAGMPGSAKDFVNATALGRCSDPSEIADLILYLASDKARGITGSTYVIDNGYALM